MFAKSVAPPVDTVAAAAADRRLSDKSYEIADTYQLRFAQHPQHYVLL